MSSTNDSLPSEDELRRIYDNQVDYAKHLSTVLNVEIGVVQPYEQWREEYLAELLDPTTTTETL